jgi:hypothetical protein
MSISAHELENTETQAHRRKKGKPRTARKRRINAETRLTETIKKTLAAWQTKVENDTSKSDAARPFLAKLKAEINRKFHMTPPTPAARIELVEWILAQLENAKCELGARNAILKTHTRGWEKLLQTLRWHKQKSELENEERILKLKNMESAEFKNKRARDKLDDSALEKFGAWLESAHLKIAQNECVVMVFGTKESVKRLKDLFGRREPWTVEIREVQSSIGTAYEVKISNTAWVRKYHSLGRAHGNGKYLGISAA